MITPSKNREDLIKGIRRGQLQTINQAKELGMLDGLLFDIVRLFSISTSSLLERAASLGSDLKIRDEQGNTLMHALAAAELHVMHIQAEKQLPLSRDYCLWAIEVLQRNGLTLQDKNQQGLTPIVVAHNNNNLMFGAALSLLDIKLENAASEHHEHQCAVL